MDVVIMNTDGFDIPVDIWVASVLSSAQRVARRQRCQGRAARQTSTLKKRHYGRDNVPLIIEDMGYVSTPARTLLAKL
eukprot:12880813-Prorocentrum_lima.AAC.1